jgi:molybdenum cofactor cytidylyltransferase
VNIVKHGRTQPDDSPGASQYFPAKGTDPAVAILLLAAGGSSRMGTCKQLLNYKGHSLLRHTAEIAVSSRASMTIVVLGAHAIRLKEELAGLPLEFAENGLWQEGIGSSIQAGVSALPSTVAGVIIMLCDQPLVSRELLNTIIGAYRSSGKGIVASEYAGTQGVPALFDRSFFPALLSLNGNTGAKSLITGSPGDVHGIPFPEGSIDIDTPADYRTIRKW